MTEEYYNYLNRTHNIPIELWNHYITNPIVAAHVRQWAWSQEPIDLLYIRIIDALCDRNHFLENALQKRIENETPVIVVRSTPE